MVSGYKFEVLDAIESKTVMLKTPEEAYSLIALIGTTERYMISRVLRASDDEIAASASTTKLALIAGKYVGKDDPVCLVRGQSGFPAMGEITAPLLHTYLVAGWMRGSHWGPFMPVGLKDSKCTVFDGPPRIVALGIQEAGARGDGVHDAAAGAETAGAQVQESLDSPFFLSIKSLSEVLSYSISRGFDYLTTLGLFPRSPPLLRCKAQILNWEERLLYTFNEKEGIPPPTQVESPAISNLRDDAGATTRALYSRIFQVEKPSNNALRT